MSKRLLKSNKSRQNTIKTTDIGDPKKVRTKGMNYEEIKRVREEFNLERHEVYTLMSEFNSMIYMSDM